MARGAHRPNLPPVLMAPMTLKIASWNINSVRLRIKLVESLLKAHKPDILCLQETKTPNDLFPAKALNRLGYKHIALHGKKGYHGVAIVSKLPLGDVTTHVFCDKDDCRHISVSFRTRNDEPVELHNFYVPAGGDVPNAEENPKFAHKLAFLKEMDAFSARLGDACADKKRIIVGDLNVAPLENDVWSHKQMLDVISHTPVEVESLGRVVKAHEWTDLTRAQVPESEKVYTWWSYRARDWQASNRGRRLDHIWASPAMAPSFDKIEIVREARGWKQPSDHVPILASFNT